MLKINWMEPHANVVEVLQEAISYTNQGGLNFKP
jgi:hypothetical protein